MKKITTKIKSSLDELNSRLEMTKEKVNLIYMNRNYPMWTAERKTLKTKNEEYLRSSICDTRIPMREEFGVIKHFKKIVSKF